MASIMPLSFLGALNSCSVSSAAVITRFDDCEGESMSHTLSKLLFLLYTSNETVTMGEKQHLTLNKSNNSYDIPSQSTVSYSNSLSEVELSEL